MLVFTTRYTLGEKDEYKIYRDNNWLWLHIITKDLSISGLESEII